LNELLSLFLNNLLPIFLVAGIGFLMSRYMGVNPRPLSQVVFYVFSPCLVFNLLTQSKLEGSEIAQVMLLAVLSVTLVGAITWTAGKFLHIERRMLASLLLVTMFMNAGNFGLPVVLFAFGQTALSYASLYFVTAATMAYTIGSVIASSGSTSPLKAVSILLKIPSVYGLVLALILMRTGWSLPLPLSRSIKLLADASIPGMLILLGLQFKTNAWANHVKFMALASAIRLVVAPLITLGLVGWFGFSGPARQAIVLESGMPSAVLSTVLATEFDAEPAFVTGTVFLNTLLSPLTLTPLLAYLGA
jgi:predicted permease